mmetsp:Transcript_44639/g.108274  ORF Transcript_44639/g.108274 Transcript_44639/m.108274 type:complete len:216 (-) Transcript_44639:601-1248(-)
MIRKEPNFEVPDAVTTCDCPPAPPISTMDDEAPVKDVGGICLPSASPAGGIFPSKPLPAIGTRSKSTMGPRLTYSSKTLKYVVSRSSNAASPSSISSSTAGIGSSWIWTSCESPSVLPQNTNPWSRYCNDELSVHAPNVSSCKAMTLLLFDEEDVDGGGAPVEAAAIKAAPAFVMSVKMCRFPNSSPNKNRGIPLASDGNASQLNINACGIGMTL